MNPLSKLFLTGSMILSALLSPLASASQLSADETRQIAKEAYIYGFPMVMHYKTMNAYILDKESPEYKAPFNYLACEARLLTPEDKAVVTPNSDTPYCMAFLDLSQEPLVLRVPKVDPKRYYSFQLVDLFTHNYAYVGTLTTGNDAADYLLAGPNWKGETPKGIKQVFRSETDIVFTTTRTQLFDTQDLAEVAKIQASYQLLPLSAYPNGKSTPTNRLTGWPKWEEGGQFDARSFNYINYMLNLVKPSDEERDIRDHFAKIGLGTGAAFNLDDQPAEVRQALEEGAKAGFAEIQQFLAKHSKDPSMSGKIFGTRSFLEKSAKESLGLDSLYLLRAAAAQAGLYGNSADEALYPSYLIDAAGQRLDASQHAYTLTFPAGSMPPVRSFWSLTMYDGKTQLLVENALGRYLLNSAMADNFVKNTDGSVILYVQSSAPDKALEPNWLPAPAGPFYLVMRLYGPTKDALEGKWLPPKLISQ